MLKAAALSPAARDRLTLNEARLRQLFPPLGNLRSTDSKVRLSMANALEVSTLHLQIEAGCPVTFSHTEVTSTEGVHLVVVEYTEEQVGTLALSLASKTIRRSAGPAARW